MNRIIFFICFAISIKAERLYIHDKLVRLEPQTNEHINYLQTLAVNSTIDFWTEIVSPNKSIDIHLRKHEFEEYISQFKQYSLPFQILVDDLQKIIDNEQQQIKQDHLKRQLKNRLYRQMKANIVGTYASYDEMIEFIQNKANNNPMYMKIIDLGQTFQGRSLKTISLQYNPSSKRNIWIDCGIHAREWITSATCIWIIEKLIEEYQNNDPIIRELLDFWNVYIAPSINPDGYEYSRTTGNRLWRKNLNTDTNSSCIGVDLNRNYPWKWMTGGSSNNPCTEIYAGKSPGSEIETQNIVNFLQSKIGTWDMYMSFHSYGQWWLTPYGYTTDLPFDYNKQWILAQNGANVIQAINNRKYTVGSIARLLYIASGSSVDWAYDVLKIPFSNSIELPPTNFESTGFILPPDQAPGVCDETYIGMKVFLNGIKKEVEMTLNG